MCVFQTAMGGEQRRLTKTASRRTYTEISLTFLKTELE